MGALTAAAAYLRKPFSRRSIQYPTNTLASYLNPTVAPTVADPQPASTSAPKQAVAPSDVTSTASAEENTSEATWADKVLPVGVAAAAGVYLRTFFVPDFSI